ncbi:MAG: ABC transporter permease [Bacteroidetes bacterium]|nr:ABC transporter permease [Bacteroidota bacterium]MBU1721028.1 ABC transporter permease [Bacteroidota bacterium]
MGKILLILRREYITRVRKRSFIIMTILGPVLMASLMIVPIWLAQISEEDKVIAVIDPSGYFYQRISNTDNLQFEYIDQNIDSVKAHFAESGYYAILHIELPDHDMYRNFVLFSDKQPSLNIEMYIENSLKKEIENLKLARNIKDHIKTPVFDLQNEIYLKLDKLPLDNPSKTSLMHTLKTEVAKVEAAVEGFDKNILQSIKTNVDVKPVLLKEGKEEKTNTEVATGLSMFAGIMIYMFIFMFGAQVMRGVIEEKTSRIVEVIISSVRPFQLMMGKIVGVALVGLTQFLLWIILTFIIVTAFQVSSPDKFSFSKTEQIISNPDVAKETMADVQKSQKVQEIFQAIGSIDFVLMITMFIFYFLGGYLLYAALFAAIGSAVDNEADTQQFMMPVTIPLILSIVVAQFVVNNPDGPISFWFSIIPFTSPVIMMIRIPFGVQVWELALSMGLLILGFLATTWFAGRIYRTGILMYGKKVSYRELGKWLFYRG